MFFAFGHEDHISSQRCMSQAPPPCNKGVRAHGCSTESTPTATCGSSCLCAPNSRWVGREQVPPPLSTRSASPSYLVSLPCIGRTFCVTLAAHQLIVHSAPSKRRVIGKSPPTVPLGAMDKASETSTCTRQSGPPHSVFLPINERSGIWARDTSARPVSPPQSCGAPKGLRCGLH